MKIAVATAVLLSVLCALGQAEEVDIEVLSAAADGCVGAANGDRIAVHYTGFLADGTSTFIIENRAEWHEPVLDKNLPAQS